MGPLDAFGMRSGRSARTPGARRSCRTWRWPSLANAPDAEAESRRFSVTHPFRPLCGSEYELVDCRLFGSKDRVVYADESGTTRSLPARWTSAAAEAPVVFESAGRSHLRVADLIELSRLVREWARWDADVHGALGGHEGGPALLGSDVGGAAGERASAPTASAAPSCALPSVVSLPCSTSVPNSTRPA